MAAKETIAFIGESSPLFTRLAQHLAKKHYPMLLVNEAETLQAKLPAAVESISCIKDGCWEADIVILLEANSIELELLEKIKEVATQKIVVYLISDKEQGATDENSASTLEQALPNSKVVRLLYEATSNKLVVSGEDEEAVAFITTLMKGMAGHTIEQHS